MPLTGVIYYYRNLLAYNAMWYYTYLVETIKPYVFSQEEITDGKINFSYLDFKDGNFFMNEECCNNINGLCILKVNNSREFYAPVALNDISKDFLEYRTTGENKIIKKIISCKSEILTASVTITTNGEKLLPFDCTKLFHKFYFPGNKIVLSQDTAETMIKLIEYEYDTKFSVDYESCSAQFVIITMSSDFFMSNDMLISISPENGISVVNREVE